MITELLAEARNEYKHHKLKGLSVWVTFLSDSNISLLSIYFRCPPAKADVLKCLVDCFDR